MSRMVLSTTRGRCARIRRWRSTTASAARRTRQTLRVRHRNKKTPGSAVASPTSGTISRGVQYWRPPHPAGTFDRSGRAIPSRISDLLSYHRRRVRSGGLDCRIIGPALRPADTTPSAPARTCPRSLADASTAEAAGDIDRRDFSDEHRPGAAYRFSETNLIHSQLSRTGDDPLLERAEDLRLVLLGQGWIELRATSTTQ